MHAEVLQPTAASKLDSACEKAMELQLAGQLDLARQLYRAILQTEPKHAVANHCLGLLYVQSQNPTDGLPFLLAALEAKPDISDYWMGVLEALILAGRTDEAQSTLVVARQHGVAGAAVEDFAKRLDEKISAGAAASETAVPPLEVPEYPARSSAPNRPVGAQKRRRTNRSARDQDFRAQERALLTLFQQGEFAAARTLARTLTERFPTRGFSWKVLGACIPGEEGYDDAIDALRTAVRLMPQDAEAHVNLGLTLAKATRFEEAERHLHHALKLNPGFSSAHYRLAAAYELQGRFAEAEASLRRGLALRTENVAGDDKLSHSHLLFLMSHNHSIDADELFAEHLRYGDYFENALRASWPKHLNDRDPERCLKVGFVSGDLCNHAVAGFIEPILAQLQHRPGLELHAYYTNMRTDDMSRQLMQYFKTWNVVCAISDSEMADVIMNDQVDVLIDLSGHTGLNRLPAFARKPAPIQISWIGYPGTTGLRAMDYYLADRHFLPPGRFDRHFTEKLVHLPANVPFKAIEKAPPVNPLPALADGLFTFGSFNRLGKITAPTVRLWSQLLREVPQARMLIGGMPTGARYDALIGEFAACGVSSERLIFHERCGILTYLELYHQVDMCLDTTPYSGGTTTFHALWMGVPTLTLAGPTPASRQGAAIVGQLGLDEFIAADAADFVSRGVAWTNRLSALADLRAELRTRWQRSPARRPEVIATGLEGALRHMWMRWCAGLPPESFSVAASFTQQEDAGA
jgi:predicted O-linked N-acetylglucosamine transferase (SPINDLY family)